MEMTYTLWGAIGIGLIVGFIVAYLIRGGGASRKIRAAEKEAGRMIENAKHQAATLVKEAELEVKDRRIKMKNDFDIETKDTRVELKEKERRLTKKDAPFSLRLMLIVPEFPRHFFWGNNHFRKKFPSISTISLLSSYENCCNSIRY